MILISRPSSPQCFQTDCELESEGLGQWFVHKTHKVLYCSCTTSVGTILEYCTWTNWMIQSYVLNFNALAVVFMCWFSVLRYTKMCVYLWASQQTAFGCGTLWHKISILIFRSNYNFNLLQFQCPDNSTDNKKTSHIHMATLLIILNGQSKFHSTSFYVVAYTQLDVHQLIEPLTAVVSFGMLHHCPPVVVMCLLTTHWYCISYHIATAPV